MKWATKGKANFQVHRKVAEEFTEILKIQQNSCTREASVRTDCAIKEWEERIKGRKVTVCHQPLSSARTEGGSGWEIGCLSVFINENTSSSNPLGRDFLTEHAPDLFSNPPLSQSLIRWSEEPDSSI